MATMTDRVGGATGTVTAEVVAPPIETVTVKPMLARDEQDRAVVERLLDDDGWIMEEKSDGMRCLAKSDGGGAWSFQSRSGLGIGKWARRLATALAPLDFVGVLDGELMADGMFILFDIARPFGPAIELERRLPLLDTTVELIDSPAVIRPRFARTADDKRQLLTTIEAEIGEGVMFKRLDSVYLEGKRSDSWRKWKIVATADCVVLSHVEGKDSVRVGVMRDGAIVDVCGVGTNSRRHGPVEPGDIVEVRYRICQDGLAEPRIMRERPDKSEPDEWKTLRHRRS